MHHTTWKLHMKVDSERVKRLRAEKHWSQEQLSEICGLNLRTIQRLENTGRASVESVRALAAVFGIEPNQLAVGDQHENPTPLDAIKTGFVRFADFTGTSSRFEFWWFFVFVLLLTSFATVIHEKAYQLVGLIVVVPFISAGTRRLNDAGQSGWWQLMYLVPFGVFLVWYLQTMASKPDSDLSGPEQAKSTTSS
jgi:transcriptional regulator with XRE-family HTH domain